MKPTKYELKDVGCYVDGNRGIYAIDRIVDFAEGHGMGDQTCDLSNHTHGLTCDQSRFAGCEFAGGIEDEATAYMNENFPVEGASWGRSEEDDWGLWAVEPPDDTPNIKIDGLPFIQASAQTLTDLCADDGEDRSDLTDDGRSDGHGESYAERNV